jgi:protein-S-isoprenylcysteine O-methyltransferase Ste14
MVSTPASHLNCEDQIAGRKLKADNHTHWWKGSRGEWLVVVQVLLIALVFFGPRTLSALPTWSLPFAAVCPIVGGALMIAGIGFLMSGLVKLGRGLTPLPYPKGDARLIETGPFGLVRHPMYSGGLVLALGWAVCVRGWLTLGYVIVLFLFLDRKSKREEAWLVEKFPTYGDYQRRVRKLVPFLY